MSRENNAITNYYYYYFYLKKKTSDSIISSEIGINARFIEPFVMFMS
jgi:hypothetical protein